MATREFILGVELYHRRIPITSELPPDFSDFAEYVVYFSQQICLFICIPRLLDVVIRAGTERPIVVNCQLGRGRSTVTSVRFSRP
jgi:Inositol hexakisphosphate